MHLQKRRSPARVGAGLRDADRTGWPDRRLDTAAIDWSASYFSVHDGRLCLGHVLVGRGEFRAFDVTERSLGIYPTRDAARQAVTDAARSAGGRHA